MHLMKYYKIYHKSPHWFQQYFSESLSLSARVGRHFVDHLTTRNSSSKLHQGGWRVLHRQSVAMDSFIIQGLVWRWTETKWNKSAGNRIGSWATMFHCRHHVPCCVCFVKFLRSLYLRERWCRSKGGGGGGGSSDHFTAHFSSPSSHGAYVQPWQRTQIDFSPSFSPSPAASDTWLQKYI